jgi:hypothetical protein
VFTDEWSGVQAAAARRVSARDSQPQPGEYIRDADGVEVLEAHLNTLEGIPTGLRDLLRRFRG